MGPFALASLGLKARKAFRVWRTRKRLDKKLVHVDTGKPHMIANPQWKSLARTALKILGAVAMTYGWLEAGQAELIVEAVTTIGGALMTLWGIWLSWKDKRSA